MLLQVETFKTDFNLAAIAINSARGPCTPDTVKVRVVPSICLGISMTLCPFFKDICAGRYQIILVSPEMMLSQRFINDILRGLRRDPTRAVRDAIYPGGDEPAPRVADVLHALVRSERDPQRLLVRDEWGDREHRRVGRASRGRRGEAREIFRGAPRVHRRDQHRAGRPAPGHLAKALERGSGGLHDELDVERGATIIPMAAVQRGSQGTYVYVVGAGKRAQIRTVTLKNNQGNDFLLRQIATPEDIWLHAHRQAGAHVVLKVRPHHEVAHQTLLQAAALAAFYSKGQKAASVEVLYTRAKYVRKFRGARPGQVQVSEYRTVEVAPQLPEV